MKRLNTVLFLACLFGSLQAMDPALPSARENAELTAANFCEISMIRGKSQGGITLEASMQTERLAECLVLAFDMKTYRKNYQWSASLYNADERVIEYQGIEDLTTVMDLSHLTPDMYFLRICGGYEEVKIFKIVKR